MSVAKEETNLSVNEHVLQRKNNVTNTHENKTPIHEVASDLMQPSTAEKVLATSSDQYTIATIDTNVIENKDKVDSNEDSSKETEGISLEEKSINNDEFTMNDKVETGLFTDKNNENISINDVTINQNVVCRNNKMAEIALQNDENSEEKDLENTSEEFVPNVQNKHHHIRTTSEINKKLNKSCDRTEEDKSQNNEHVSPGSQGSNCKENKQLAKHGSHVSHDLSNVTNGICESDVTHHSCHVTMVASGKVNYAIFPNNASHHDITDDQLQQYLEDELYDSTSVTKKTVVSFKENQGKEFNIEDFEEISLEVR